MTPRPLDADFTAGKMKFREGNLDLGYFWYTNFWFQNPPPPPEQAVCCVS